MKSADSADTVQTRRRKERGIHPIHLRAWRHYRILSQPELAELAGLTRAAVSKLETQRDATAKPETIGKLAKALGISREQLVREAPPVTDDMRGEDDADPAA